MLDYCLSVLDDDSKLPFNFGELGLIDDYILNGKLKARLCYSSELQRDDETIQTGRTASQNAVFKFCGVGWIFHEPLGAGCDLTYY